MAILIEPNSSIKLLTDIPFNNTYKYTTKFSSKSAQTEYFNTKVKKTFSNLTYIRKERKVRIDCVADDILDCNYIMFQNSAFGSKWFYAFITDIEYVNNNASHISYELDVMQTWQFDFEVMHSFIEREHAMTDEIGINLVPENLELGEYVFEDLGLTSLFNMYQIVVACTFNNDEELTDAVGGMYGGVYSGLKYHAFASYTSANAFLEKATAKNKTDSIVSIFMLPIAFCSELQETKPELFTIERDKHQDYGAYKPKNNKLYTYPYQMLYVTNNEGTSANFPFEYFDGDKCKFELSGAMCATPECMIVPLNYKGVPKNYNEKMLIANFPQCAYNIDAFKAYVAQNSMRLVASVGTGIVQGVVGGVTMAGTGGAMGTDQAVGGLSNVINSVAMLHDISTQPPQSRGTQSSIINMANEIKGFQFYYARIRTEFARIIDDFFSAYGYATKRIKKPNINTRPHWNYVKTIDVNIIGSVPADDLQRIRNIFDNGVTFWRNPNNIGRYDLDNRP